MKKMKMKKIMMNKLVLAQLFFWSIQYVTPLYITPFKKKIEMYGCLRFAFKLYSVFFYVVSTLPNVYLDSPVLVLFSVATNLAWDNVGVGNWHENLKQVLIGA